MMLITRKKSLDNQYISKSLVTVKKNLGKFSEYFIKRSNEIINSKFFRHYKSSIHFYKNKTDLPINLSYENSTIIANIYNPLWGFIYAFGNVITLVFLSWLYQDSWNTNQ